MKKLLAILFMGGGITSNGQNSIPVIKGNDLYRKQQYEQAVKEYEKALEENKTNPIVFYNYANALYRTGSAEKATKIFDSLAKAPVEDNLRSASHYNVASILSRQLEDVKANNKKIEGRPDVLGSTQTVLLEQSIEFYKKALRINPTDKQARENLQKALLELKKKNPPKKQDEKKKEQPPKQPKPKISPKQAEQQLKLLQEKEKQVQQKLQKNSSKTGNALPKDW